MYGGEADFYGNRVAGVRYGQPQAVASASAQGGVHVFNARAFKIYGAILAILAAATLSLGIANVVLTKETYCNPWTTDSPMWCSTTAEPYIWTWVASGIWASIPIFFAGIFAMCLSSNPGKWTRVFALLIFLSAIVFAPGMCVLSSIEVWRGSESSHNFYKLDNGIKEGDIMPDDNPYQAKFALPLVIAILAAIMFIMTAIITLQLCCCMHALGIYQPEEISVLTGGVQTQVVQQQVVAPQPQIIQNNREVYYPSRPQVRNNYYDINLYGSGDPYQAGPPTNMATRYNPSAANVMSGNFAGRGNQINNGMGSQFAADFFKPNPSYFWQ